MIRFLINTLLFYTIIVHNALSLFNEPKTYAKLYTYVGYSYQSITNNNYDYKQQNHNLSVGVGYNIYYKYNDLFDSFVGLQFETRIPVSPFFGRTQQHSFSNFMSFDMIFGAKFKINNDIALQPFLLFGFNVNHAKYNTTQQIKEVIFKQEEYDDDVNAYNIEYVNYQNELATYNNNYANFLTSKAQWEQAEQIAHDTLSLDEYDTWRNNNPRPEFTDIEPTKPTAPDRNDDIYYEETGRTIQGHKKGNENKVGLDIGFGFDAILYDRFIVGMEYKYLSVQSGIETKIHQFSTKVGVLFDI